MKTSGSKTGGIVIIILGAFLTIMFLSFAIYNVASMFSAPASEWPDPYASSNNGVDLMKGALAGGMFFLALCCVPLIIIGVYSLKRGIINQKVVREGRPSTCIVEDLRSHRFRHGVWTYQLIVSYKDDNGGYQRYSTQIPCDRYQELKIGMTLECLVSGDECYIDPMNIIEVDNPID